MTGFAVVREPSREGTVDKDSSTSEKARLIWDVCTSVYSQLWKSKIRLRISTYGWKKRT